MLPDQGRIIAHALNVGAGFRVAELGRACEVGDRFALSAGFPRSPAGPPRRAYGAVAGSEWARRQRASMLRTGLEFMTIDRFVQEVGRSALQGVGGSAFVVCGDHQDRGDRLRGGWPWAADELDAVDLRHHVIDDEKIRIVAEAPLQAFAGLPKQIAAQSSTLFTNACISVEVQRGVSSTITTFISWAALV